MRIKKIASIFTISIGMVSLGTYADISITNNTKSYGTAKGNGTCSSQVAGDNGIMPPGWPKPSHAVIPQWAVDLYCPFGCTVSIYPNKNCSGKSIATVKANPKKGVTKIINNHVDGYIVSGGGRSVSIDGGPKKSFFDLLF